MRTPQIAAIRLIAIALTTLGMSGIVQAQEAYFPDLVFLPKNKEVNSLIDSMTSVHLRAMNEPSLWKLSQKKQTATIYRFLWLRGAGKPVCIRLTRTGDSFDLHVGGHDGSSGLTAGRQNLDRNLRISAKQGEKILAEVQKSNFWKAPVEVKETRGIADGDGIVIEGTKDGKYHVIDRHCSVLGDSYKVFCRSLLELADEPAHLRTWNSYCEGERKSPDYRREPPETEDLGDYQTDQ